MLCIVGQRDAYSSDKMSRGLARCSEEATFLIDIWANVPGVGHENSEVYKITSEWITKRSYEGSVVPQCCAKIQNNIVLFFVLFFLALVARQSMSRLLVPVTEWVVFTANSRVWMESRPTLLNALSLVLCSTLERDCCIHICPKGKTCCFLSQKCSIPILAVS